MQETKKQPELPITILENPVVVGGKYGSYSSDFLKNTKGDLFALIDRKIEEIIEEGTIVGWRINVHKIAEDIKDMFKMYAVLQPDGSIKNYTVNGEEVVAINISQDGTKVEVQTLYGENLGRFYFNPQKKTKLSRFQLNGEDVVVTNISQDGTKVRAKTLKGKDLGQCYLDPNDQTKISRFQIDEKKFIISNISKNWTTARVKTSCGINIGECYLDPNDKTKLWILKVGNEDVLVIDISHWIQVRVKKSTGENKGRCYLDPNDKTKLWVLKFENENVNENVVVTDRSEDGTKVEVKTLDGRILGRCYLDPNDKTKLWVLKFRNQNLLVTGLKGKKVQVKTLTGEDFYKKSIGKDLGRFYLDPNDPTKLLRFQIDGKDIIATNISEDGTKVEVKTSEGEYLGRCYLDSQDQTKLLRFQIDGKDVIVTNYSKDGKKVEAKKSTWKKSFWGSTGEDLGRCCLDPNNETKIRCDEHGLPVIDHNEDDSIITVRTPNGLNVTKQRKKDDDTVTK